MAKIILCNRPDAREIIEEEKQKWIFWVLLNLKVPEAVIEQYDDIDKYRFELDKRGIDVIHNIGKETICIYKKKWYNDGKISGWLDPTEDHLVAQWSPPVKVKKMDKGGTYYEVHINAWSIFGSY